MSDVFYLRPAAPPIDGQMIREMADSAGGCFGLHRVTWRHSFLASDCSRMMCWYQAPDAESARLALRQLGSDLNAVFAGRAEPADEDDAAGLDLVNVVVELEAEHETPTGQQPDRTGSTSQGAGSFEVVREIALSPGARRVLLVRASEVSDVTKAFEASGVTPDRVWSCTPVAPDPA